MPEQYLRSTGHAMHEDADGNVVKYEPGDVVPPDALPGGVIARWLERGALELVTPDVPAQAAAKVEEPFEGAAAATVPEYLDGVVSRLESSELGARLEILAQAWAYEHANRARRGVYAGLATNVSDAIDL